MSYAALGFLRQQYLCVLRRCAWFNAGLMSAGLFALPGMFAHAAGIVPDGRTATQVSTQGGVTEVNTATIRGVHAYNSFTRFNVDAGHTVNLHLPGQTQNLLNLVHGESSYINGLVNAYREGRIGGNVFFFNPHGIVVGSSGVLNVGSLTLATPTTGFMDRLISPAGVIDADATAQALAGQVPLSQSGLVLVQGRVHAADAVTLAGGNVVVDAGAQVLAGGRAQVAFANLVNVAGVQSGTQVRIDGGSIQILADDDITVAGEVAADGVGAAGAGGRVFIMAQDSATLMDSGRVSADGAGGGAGGFVEFSAVQTVNLHGNGLSARGAGGQILIDPVELIWRGAGHDFHSFGSDIKLLASDRIVLDDVLLSSRNIGSAANTRHNHANLPSFGASGDIELVAKVIELRNGTQLLAHGGNGHAAGNVTLAATDNQSTPAFGSVEDSVARIVIDNAVIRGGNVSIRAVANDKWVWTGNEYGDAVLDFLGSLRIGANITFSNALATVDVGGGALIDASGGLDVEAHAIADASMNVMSTVVGFGYGETDAVARVTIGNASLGADGAMNLKSQADSTLSVSVSTVNTGRFSNAASKASKYANFGLAVGIGNQTAETTVGNAATVSRASSLNVEASGSKAHEVAASGGSFKDGIASAGVAVLISDTTLNARLGGNINAAEVAVRSTLTDAETAVSAAAGTAGSPDVREAITSARPVDQILFEKLSDFVAAAPEMDQRSGATSKLGLSAAFAWADNHNDVLAEVSDHARVTTPGRLLVHALAEERLAFEASAAVDQRDLGTQLPGDPNAPEDKKKIAISASVAVIDVTHHAEARIGNQAVIQAGGAVSVLAQSLVTPFWQQWVDIVSDIRGMDWNSPGAWLELGENIYALAGDPVGATSWTQTGVESEKLAFAGTVDFFSIDQQATAVIGDADINAGVVNPGANQDVTVAAQASHGILNLVGVPEFDPSTIGSGSVQSGSAGFGGAYHQLNVRGGSDASIARGATLNADDVAVVADTDFNAITLTKTMGKAGKVSINGAFSLIDAEVDTIAQIGSGVTVNANDVLVHAHDDSLLINAAGGVARSGSVGIGFSIAINDVDRETRALVGNRPTQTGSGGSLSSRGNLLVHAESSGTQGAFAVAGAGPAGPDDPNATGGDGTKTKAADTGKQGKSGVGISGAATVNLVHDVTAATVADLAQVSVAGTGVSGVNLDRDGDGTADRTFNLQRGFKARALNDTLVLAGAGALTIAADRSAGLAGAFTWNQLVKDTRAAVADTQVKVVGGSVDLEADNTGAMWSMSAGGSAGGKVGVAGSVSYSSIDNVTEASIDRASVDADSTVVLHASDDSDIRSVAGSASYGGKAGVGAAVAISTVDSDTTARISGAGSTVNGDAGVSVSAINDNSIVAVAAAIGASQGVAVSGAVTVNIISNRTEALLSGASVTSSGNLVHLDADDLARILSISGNAAISTGQASVGISASYNEIDNETYARAVGGSISATGVRLEATEQADIQAIAAGGAGASKVAVSGSLGINTIGNITAASTTGTTLTTGGSVMVRAADDSEILSITGVVSAAGTGAVGASGSYNHIGSTVTAAISGGSVNAAHVAVDADRTARMEVWAVAGSGAGTAGFAGSIALNDIGGTTTARIDAGAQVEASGNVLVTAESDDRIDARAGAIGVGGSVGGAGSIAVNNVHADTLAQVTGNGTRVTGLGQHGVAQVDNGQLAPLTGLPSGQPLDARQRKDNLRGVAVVASSTAQVENFAISAGGGGSAGVAGTVSVAMMTGYTTAEVSAGAQLNHQLGSAHQEARVAAYHHDNLTSGSGGAAIGGNAGAGGAMDTLVASHVTTVEIRDAAIQAQKAVTVDAGSTLEIAQAIIGLGGGTYAGLSGSIGLVLQEGRTQALVYDSDLDSRGDLTVAATSTTDADLYAGAASLSGVAGIGLTASVSIYDQTTQAVVGDGSRLNAVRTTRIEADNDIRQEVLAGTASAAGGVGVAGTVNVTVIKGDTQAVFGFRSDAGRAASSINANPAFAGTQQDVVVEARDETRIENYLGSLGVGMGGAGVGATADVIMVNSGATAEIRSGATVRAQRDIVVEADSERVLDSFTIAAAGGFTTGISGAVSVLTAGSRPDADANSEIGGSVGEAARLASANAFGNQLDSDAGGTTAARDAANAARARANVGHDLNAPVAPTSARAAVASGATLNAGRDVRIDAFNATDADAVAVGVAVSGGAALGGGIALAFIDDRTQAEAAGTITAGRNVTVRAADGAVSNDDQGLVLRVGDVQVNQRTADSTLLTFAGGGGLVGLGASVAIMDKDSDATARIGNGATITALGSSAAAPGGVTGLVTVEAGVDHGLKIKGMGAAVGLAGVGVAIARVDGDGDARAEVGDGARITGTGLDVHAHSRTDNSAHVVAAAGGVFAGAGADAQVTDTASATAELGDNVVIRTLGGHTQVRASVDPRARAYTLGAAVSAGVSIGVSLAEASVQTQSRAATGSGLDVIADDMTVLAETRARGNTAESDAIAGAGGLLLGASGASSRADVQTTTVAELGADSLVRVSDELRVAANSVTRTDADVTGVNIGLVAAGSAASRADANTVTQARVGASPDIRAARLDLSAHGNDTLHANTVAGSGGLGALTAAKAETEAHAQTHARLGEASATRGSVRVGSLNVEASQRTDFNAFADSLNAAVVGFSGARAHNTVHTDTQASIGDNLDVFAQSVRMRAWNEVVKAASSRYNVDSGSGGLLNGAAARAETLIRNHALVAVGRGALVDVDVAGIQTGVFELAAWNQVDATDRVRLDSGGAIAIARAESVIDNTRNDAAVRVGENARLFSDGDIDLSARTDARVRARAHSKTFGLAGAAQGGARAAIVANNHVGLAANALVEAEGDLRLMAGTDRNQANDLLADAETRLWNYTVLPVENDPEAHGSLIQHNTIAVAAGARARSVKNVYLTATEGTHRVRGFGEGTDAYRETLSAIGQFFGADTSSLKISGGSTYDNANDPFGLNPASGVHVDGTVQAGIWHHQWLTLAADGSTVTSSEAMANRYRLRDNVSLANELAAEIAALRAAAQAARDAANSYAGSHAADAALALDNDARILEQQLAALSDPQARVGFIDIADTQAQSGNIRVTGQYLSGGNSARLEAPGNVRIDIENRSKRFMQTAALTIPDEGGGQITFNGLRVSSNADINARNSPGRVANIGTLLDAATSPAPVIRVENTNDANTAAGVPAQLWMRGEVNNLGGEAIAKSHGTLRVSANINAETVNIATGGDFIKTYTPGFTHQGGDPVAQLGDFPRLWEQFKVDHSTNSPPRNCGAAGCSTTIAGNNVYISGERLNINGLIQAGLPERLIVIDQALLNATNPDQGIANSLAISKLRDAWRRGDRSVRYLDLNRPAPESNAIKVRYDAEHDRLELANVRIGGGHMELFGNVFSTGNGELRVMDGYGRINVTNTTGYDLAIGRLDTGPGVEGMIRITDTSRRGVNNAPLITEITRLGNQIETRDSTKVDAQGRPATVIARSSGRNGVFNPTPNRRFNWINGDSTEHLVRDVYTTRYFVGSDALAADQNPEPVHTPLRIIYTPRLSGDWLSDNETRTVEYHHEFTQVTTPRVITRNEHLPRRDCGIYDCVDHVVERRWYVHNYYHHSLNASKPVNVTFTGFDTADVRVDAGNNQLLLGGLVRGLTGDTRLNAQRGIQSLSDDARIVASNLILNSTQGAIGSASKPVHIDLTEADAARGLVNGQVSANGRTGVALKEVDGNLRAVNIQAQQGDVFLTADRNLVGIPGITVFGNNIRLVSLSGGIGTTAMPLIVDTLGTTTVLSAQAAGDIHLREATGDMRVRQIRSSAGNVHLSVPGGSLLDANPAEQVDELARAELLLLWEEMRLTGSEAERARDRHLQAQATRLKQEYENYFRMRNLHRLEDGTYRASAYDPNFTYQTTPAQAAALKAANHWSDAEVAAFEAKQTAAYHAAYQRFGDGAYIVGYAPTLTVAETDALSKGAVWSDAQLSNAIAAGLFRPVTDTELRIEEANVVGNDLNFSVAGGVGHQNHTALEIRRADLENGLSEAQRLALLTAELDDIVILPDLIRITSHEDVDVTATGSLRVLALGDDVLLGSEGNLHLEHVLARGEARIKTALAMTGVSGRTHVTAQRAILEAGGGQMGTASDPIRVELPNSGALTARAYGDLHLAEQTGDMVVESVFSRATVHLSAPGSIVEATPDTELDVRGHGVRLVAGGTIGRPGADNALDVAVSPRGRLDATAPDGVYLNSTGAAGRLGDVLTQGIFHLSVADGSMTLVGTVLADAGVALGAVDDIVFEGGSVASQGLVNIQAGVDGSGSLIVGDTPAGVGIHSGADLYLGAADDILLAADVHAQGNMLIDAGSDIRIQGALTAAGDAALGAVDDIVFEGGSVASQGTVNIQAGGDGSGSLMVGNTPGVGIHSEADLHLGAADDILLGADVHAQGNMLIDAGSDIRIQGALTAAGDAALGAGFDIVFEGGSVASQGSVNIQAGGDGSGSLMVGNAPGAGIHSEADLHLGAADDIEIRADVHAQGNMLIDAGSDIRIQGALTAAGDAALGAGFDIVFEGGSVASQGLVNIQAGVDGSGSLMVGNTPAGIGIHSDADLYLSAADDIVLGADVHAQGNMLIDAGSDIRIQGALTAAGDAALGAADDIVFEGGSVASQGLVNIQAGGDGSGSVLGWQGVQTDVAAADDVTIHAPDAIGAAGTPLEVVTQGGLDLRARYINVQLDQPAPAQPAEVWVSGPNGILADEVMLNVRGASEVLLHTFLTGNGATATDSPILRVIRGHVGDWVTFQTPYFSARIDRLQRAAPTGMEVRGFTLTGDFDLLLTPDAAYIGAYVINQNPRRIVYSNPGGFTDQENEEALRTLQNNPGLLARFGVIDDGAPAIGELVRLDPEWLDDEALMRMVEEMPEQTP